jgi:hypothetical protein
MHAHTQTHKKEGKMGEMHMKKKGTEVEEEDDTPHEREEEEGRGMEWTMMPC